MKKVIVLMGAIALWGLWGFPQSSQAWEWRPAASLDGPPTWFSAAFAVGDTAFVCTGYGFGNSLRGYDPAGNAWTRKADFPGKARGSAVAFSIGSKGYIGLGFGENERFADLWEYDPAADCWTQKASLPAAGRDHAGAFVLDGKAYVFGGTRGEAGNDDFLKEVWAYDPAADRWTRKSDMPESTATPACFVLDGKGYFGTGVASAVPYALSKVFWEYNPKTDGWTRKAEFPGTARFRAVGFSRDGKGYIGTGLLAMGEASADVAEDLWEYDPKTNAWTPKPAFAGPARGAAVAFVLGSRVYIGTGTDSGRKLLSDFWRS